MTSQLIVCLVFAAFVTVLIEASPVHAKTTSSAPALRRYALVIGSNTGGGAGRDTLRYAGQDARTIADVLRQLGGVTQLDLTLLKEPDKRELDSAFDALSKRVQAERKAGQRAELVVYYSGHADENGILIGGTRYDYARLRQRIRAVPADVHIAIVDSCASGSFTRIKGGTKVPPFLHDTSTKVEGFAFLSSSSADEDAQESDRIGASFFTYFFVAALRGAADRNRDGRITLTEAYQFSYEHTLGRTQNTRHGPQHPAYDMHLSGTGDVVITDLRSTESTLVLPPALKGRVTIVDESGRVAVELTKEAGEPLSLALPNETYTVRVENNGGEFIATITLDKLGEVELDAGTLRKATKKEKTVARGLSVEEDDDDDRSERHDPWYREIPISFGGGLRVERPTTRTDFDALVTIGGAVREVHGKPFIGVADTAELFLGATLGDNVHFAYDMSLGFGPGVFLGRNLQVGATIGFGFSGITGGVLDFAWKMPTEVFAVLELSPDIRPMAYFRQSYLFSSDARQKGSKMARWGDEAEAGVGMKFSGKLDGFFYGSLREMAGERYWGIGLGAVL
ncbi:MAG: caspase family protein [Myxococcota bacterium]|nr:caspase family protein [Deltaproteobacteria bacterium]MDQ3335679.1 caspase family protein [Myxococcota bacterium]